MRIVVGLGNPGARYAGSRHNVGFAVVDELAQRWRILLGPIGNHVHAAEGTIAGKQTILVQPQMYMNLSGAALTQMNPELTASELVVIHDDLDLELGRIRVKHDGGTAGHRGLDSIVAHYGTAFTRVRVGVGKPCAIEVVDHVLTPFDNDERHLVSEAIQRAADAVECVLGEGQVVAMNRFNARPKSGLAATAPMGRK